MDNDELFENFNLSIDLKKKNNKENFLSKKRKTAASKDDRSEYLIINEPTPQIFWTAKLLRRR